MKLKFDKVPECSIHEVCTLRLKKGGYERNFAKIRRTKWVYMHSCLHKQSREKTYLHSRLDMATFQTLPAILDSLNKRNKMLRNCNNLIVTRTAAENILNSFHYRKQKQQPQNANTRFEHTSFYDVILTLANNKETCRRNVVVTKHTLNTYLNTENKLE